VAVAGATVFAREILPGEPGAKGVTWAPMSR